jgi:hypothetical protein
MANTIRIKRGASSDISKANLVQGELAITTDTHELYTADASGTAVKVGGGNTYTLSKSGSTIKLTGSDGSETSVTDSDTKTTYSNASSSAAGLMSSAHYSKLQNLPDNEHLQWAYPFEDYFWGDVDTNIDWTTFKLDYTTGSSMNLYLGEAHTTVDGVTMNLPKGTHCVATCDGINNIAVLWFFIPAAVPIIKTLTHNYGSDSNTVSTINGVAMSVSGSTLTITTE